MKKKLLSLLLSLALCLSLLPTAALAADPTTDPDLSSCTNDGGTITTTGLDLSSWPTNTRYQAGEGAVYFVQNDTLVLYNATIDGSSLYGWALRLKNMSGSLTIELKGKNTLTGGLNISGSSNISVEIVSGEANGSTPVLNVTRANAGNSALYSEGTLTISGSVVVNAEHTNNSGGNAIGAGSITISGATVNATSSRDIALSYIRESGALSIENGATVTATTGSDAALSSGGRDLPVTVDNSTLTISGGTSEIKNTFTVENNGKVTVNPGTTVKFTGSGALANSGTFVNNGTVNFTGTNAPANKDDVEALNLSGTGYVTSMAGGSPATSYSNTGNTLNTSGSNLTLGDADQGDLAVNGYKWTAANKELKLKNVILNNVTVNVTAPPAEPIYIIAEDCVVIGTLDASSLGSNQHLYIKGSSASSTLSVSEMQMLLYSPSMMLENLTATFGNISSAGTNNKLTLKNAAITTGLVNWPDYNSSDPTSGVKLEGSSTLTVNGDGSYNNFVAATIDLSDNSKIVLNNAGATSGNPTLTMESYKAYLPNGYTVASYEYSEGNFAYAIMQDTSYTPARQQYTVRASAVHAAPASAAEPIVVYASAVHADPAPVLTLATSLTLQPHYTVTFDPNGGTFNNDVLTNSQFTSTTATSPVSTRGTAGAGLSMPGISRIGYTFSGWSPSATTFGTRDIIVTAQWTVNSTPSPTPTPTPPIIPPLTPPSGSGSTDYRITVSEPVNGTVEASRRFAEAGTTITVTTAPTSGYGLETLTVLDRNNREVALTDLGGGKYTFRMPSSNVTVSAYFSLLPNFDDVDPDDYFYQPVRWAVNNDITNGIGGGKFGPDLTCTRAQIVTFLWRTSGQPIAERTEMPFIDAVPGSFYYDAVLWATETGVTLGTSDTTFSPDLICTREQAVTFLYRYAQLNGIDTSVGEDTNILSYTDALEVSDFAVPAMQWAVGSGVVQGAGGKLMPLSDCTRGQIITMLYRTMNP